MTRPCPQPLWVILGQPCLLLPRAAEQRNGKDKTKGKGKGKKQRYAMVCLEGMEGRV